MEPRADRSRAACERDGRFARRARALHVTELALIAAGVLVGLLVVELALRMVPGLLPETVRSRLAQLDARRTGHTRFIVADDEIGFLYRPDLRETIERAEFRYVLATDHAGFRNATPWPDRPDMVVVGDSMAAGEGVAAEAAWPFHLAASVGASVVSLAMNGASPPQMSRVLARLGLPLRPALVLMEVFPANDYREAAAFEAWRRAGRPVPFADWLDEPPSELEVVTWLRRVLEGSRLRLLVREALRATVAGAGARHIALAEGGRVLLAGGAWEQAADLARGDGSGIRPVVAAILEARAMATAAGARFLLVILPSKEEVYAQLGGVAPPELAGPLLAALRGQAIPTADLREPLRRRARAGETLYFGWDGHLTEGGHRAVAEELRPWILTVAALAPLHGSGGPW